MLCRSAYLYNRFSSQLRRGIHLSSQLRFPVQNVEVLALSGGGSAAQSAALRRIVAPVGVLVSAGDVVALLGDGAGEDSTTTTQIRSPNSGKIHSFHYKVGDSVDVGRALFSLDTDAAVPSDIADFMQHLATNKGKLDNEFFKPYLELNEPDRVWSLAVLLVERFPSLSVQALQLLERLKDLQQNESETGVEEKVQTYVYAAQLLWTMGDLDQAAIQAKAAVDLDSSNVEAHNLHGQFLMYTGKIEMALESYEQVLKLVKGKPSSEMLALHQCGQLLAQIGKHEASLDKYEQALNRARESTCAAKSSIAECHYLVSQARQRLNPRDPKILEHLTEALQLHHQSDAKSSLTADAHVRLGLALIEFTEYNAGLEQLEAAKAIKVNDSKVYSALGSAHYQISVAQQRTTEEDDDNHVPENMAVENYQKAVSLILSESKASPTDVATGWNNLGTAQLQSGDVGSAMNSHTSALQCLESAPSSSAPDRFVVAETNIFLGVVYRQQNRLDKSLESHRKGHSILTDILGDDHVDVASSHNNIGGILLGLRHVSEALEEYQKACRIFETNLGKHGHTAAAHFNIGVCLQKLGDRAAAREHYEASKAMWRGNSDRVSMASEAIESCRD